MMKTLKKIWRKIDFLGLFRFTCRLPYILLAVGLVLYAIFFVTDGQANFHITKDIGFSYEGERLVVRKNIEKGLETCWVQKEGIEPYLNVSMAVKETPYLFDRQDVEKEVIMQLKPWNYKVEARKSNRENGFVVKEDYRYESRVRAFYTTDVEIDGKNEPRLWLVSQSYLDRKNLGDALKKYEIEIPR